MYNWHSGAGPRATAGIMSLHIIMWEEINVFGDYNPHNSILSNICWFVPVPTIAVASWYTITTTLMTVITSTFSITLCFQSTVDHSSSWDHCHKLKPIFILTISTLAPYFLWTDQHIWNTSHFHPTSNCILSTHDIQPYTIVSDILQPCSQVSVYGVRGVSDSPYRMTP